MISKFREKDIVSITPTDAIGIITSVNNFASASRPTTCTVFCMDTSSNPNFSTEVLPEDKLTALSNAECAVTLAHLLLATKNIIDKKTNRKET